MLEDNHLTFTWMSSSLAGQHPVSRAKGGCHRLFFHHKSLQHESEYGQEEN